MVVRSRDLLPALYEIDETAWLDSMAVLARDGRKDELDLPHLAEYLADMTLRERREVESRLVVLLCHLLKFENQPGKRSRGWRATIIVQRQELKRHAAQGVLRLHAEKVLADVYLEDIERAAVESGLSPSLFPTECLYSFAQLLVFELPPEEA